jgi:hypothetical protein
VNYDASIAHQFAVSERLRFELRGEFFNAPDHPNPNGLVTLFGNRAFGQMNALNLPRYAQASGRVAW